MSPHFRWFLVGVALIATLVYLMGCASSGLYAMSDEWCNAHPDASAAHCTEKNEVPMAPGVTKPGVATREPAPIITLDCAGVVSLTFGTNVVRHDQPEWNLALFALNYYIDHGGVPVVVNTCEGK